MKPSKLVANLIFASLLALSVIVSGKTLDYGMSLAYSGKEFPIWIGGVGFLLEVGLVLAAIIVKAKYGK
jgi:hypothetical protein